MKTKNKFYLLALCALACVLMNTKTMNGQFNNAQSVQEFSATTGALTPAATATGNDILDVSGDVYAVSVWDDPSSSDPGIGWRHIPSGGGSPIDGYSKFAQTTDIFDPDVCLVDYSGNIYAIAVYCKRSSPDTYYWEVFLWTGGGTNAFVTQGANSFSSDTYNTTLNIDSDDNDHFAIVWDNTTPRCSIRTGYNNSGTPALNGPAPVASGSSPDVSLNWDGVTEYVYVTYLNNSGNLNLDRATYAASPSFSNIISVSPQTSCTYYYPRVACPNSSGSATDWTVVVEENDGSNYYIDGFNNNSGSTRKIYNDGNNNSPANITSVPNHFPVVTYDDTSPRIWIGWTMDNSGGGIGGSTPPTASDVYPIVLKCDNTATIPASSTYWEVPYYTNLTGNDGYDQLSLAGRYGADKLFLTFADVVNSDVMHKIIDPISTATQFKTVSGMMLNETMAGKDLAINFPDGILTMSVFDITGKKVLMERGRGSQIQQIFRDWFAGTNHKSIYLLRINSDEGFNLSKKIMAGY
jgi:hypothetical protein